MRDKPVRVGEAAKRAAIAALGDRLRTLRIEAAMTQQQVARAVGVSTQSVRNWEAGRNGPGAEAFSKLSDLFNIPIGEIASPSQGQVDNAETRTAAPASRVDPRRLRRARTELGMTQVEAAKKAGITKAIISQYETGQSIPSAATLRHLAEAYRRPATWFINDGPDSHGESEPDEAMSLYAVARPDLSHKDKGSIADFIAFLHHRSLERADDT